jgi:hypothetical protein
MNPVPPGSELVATLAESEAGGGQQQYVLHLKNRHGEFVLKHFGAKQGRMRTLVRQFGSLFLVGKSSIAPGDRKQVEEDTLALWRQEGFHVPGPPAFPVEGLDPDLDLALEFVKGEPLNVFLMRKDRTDEEILSIVRLLAEDLARRHARALELAEPRLLLERPTLEHFILSGDRIVNLDLEIVYTNPNLTENLARRELSSVFLSIYRSRPVAYIYFLEEFLRHYPDHDRLRKVAGYMKDYGGVPLKRSLTPLYLLQRWKIGDKRRKTAARELVKELDAWVKAGGSPPPRKPVPTNR